MFANSTRRHLNDLLAERLALGRLRGNSLLALLFVAFSACGGTGSGCGGCASTPLPAGGLPVDQTIEGGAQVRVTQSGFGKISTLIEDTLASSLGGGICVGNFSTGDPQDTFGTGATACTNQDGTCNPGCNVGIDVTNLVVTPNGNDLNVQVNLNVATTVPLHYQIVGIGGSCNMSVSANNLSLNADITPSIDDTTGELKLDLTNINSLSLNLSFDNCGLVSGLLSIITDVLDFLDNFLNSAIINLFTPTLDNLVQSFLPNPLGIEGSINIGAMVASVSPDTKATLETRLVPGGYVNIVNNGLSLGMITGFNSDQDPTTRDQAHESEPVFCVPPIPDPNFAAAPFSLPTSSRNTFTLLPAGAFNGAPDTANSDLAFGISHTTLNLLGHHLINSGELCLGIGPRTLPQLNVGMLSLLVPSLGELTADDTNNPLQLVIRPQQDVTFDIGDGTSASPSLTMHITNLEVDFYAFLYERYTRAFTLSLTLNVGINLTVAQDPGQPATLTPMLSGIDAADIQMVALNTEFVRETPATLEARLPTIFSLLAPLITSGIPAITVPSFAGFQLTGINFAKVTTSQDDFLALTAGLAASPTMTRAVPHNDKMRALIDDRDESVAAAPSHSTARAQLKSISVPAPSIINASLDAKKGAMPTVTIDVENRDEQNRVIEWSWNINGGMWRTFSDASPLVIADPAFVWQGKYTIELKSRVKGDPRTTSSQITSIPVIIDSVAPSILANQASVVGDVLHVPARDIVSSDTDLQWAYGKPGDTQPSTPWTRSDAISTSVTTGLTVNGQLGVFVKDEAGNVAYSLVVPVVGAVTTPDTGGCSSTTAPNGGTLIVILLSGAMLMFGTRRRRASLVMASKKMSRGAVIVTAWLGLSVVVSMFPACDCGNKASGKACEVAADCAAMCMPGQIASCMDGACSCTDDVPAGKIGPYSDIATSTGGSSWVSAYAETYGDLVVAQVSAAGRIVDTDWEWVDGVPAVTPEVAGSMIRGGITDTGPDVGMYTSIAVQQDGTPMVTYYDRDSGSLKFAAKVAGTWQTHVIDAGDGAAGAPGDTMVGMFTSLSLRSDDGRPGVAYLANVTSNGVTTAEVRFAAAQVAKPASAADWTTFTVESVALPPADPNSPDPFPLPGGLGLFVNVTRGPDNAPVVVYYDRTNGNLHLAQFDANAGTFGTPTIIAGGASVDAGWSPSVKVGSDGVVHVAYVDATANDLNFYSSDTNTSIVLDSGYRIVGTTVDGFPKPEFHFVGANATLLTLPNGPAVVYQDATDQSLLLIEFGNGTWQPPITVASGATTPYVGSFGFFAAGDIDGTNVVISNWVIDQAQSDNWVEVFYQPYIIQ